MRQRIQRYARRDVWPRSPKTCKSSRRLSAAASAAKAGLWNNTALCAAAAKVVEAPGEAGALARRGIPRRRRPHHGRTARRSGRRPDGRLTALIHTGMTATPTHARYAEQCTFPARHLYAAENLSVGQKVVNLDTVANTWMRAPGESIGTFASGVGDRRTRLCDDRSTRSNSAGSTSPQKIRRRARNFRAAHLTEAYRRGAEKFGWSAAQSRNRAHSATADGWSGRAWRRLTIPSIAFPRRPACASPPTAPSIVQAPAHEMGMGTATVQIQHAADRLGLPIDRVSFRLRRLRAARFASMAGGSNQTASIAAACRRRSRRLTGTARAGAGDDRFAACRREVRTDRSARRRTFPHRRADQGRNLRVDLADAPGRIMSRSKRHRPCRWR